MRTWIQWRQSCMGHQLPIKYVYFFMWCSVFLAPKSLNSNFKRLQKCPILCLGNWKWKLHQDIMKFLTWDQAQFSFRFANNIPAGKAERKESLKQAFTKHLRPTFLIDWHLLNQPTKIACVACFLSMQIIHMWKNCRLTDLKNCLYFLIFSTKNKTGSTNHI